MGCRFVLTLMSAVRSALASGSATRDGQTEPAAGSPSQARAPRVVAALPATEAVGMHRWFPLQARAHLLA
jgi:hypothetical protein